MMIVAVLLLKWMSMKAVYRKMVRPVMPSHFWFVFPHFVYALLFCSLNV